MLDTAEGRKKFWAEKANEEEGYILFQFPSGITYKGKIIKKDPNQEFQLIYFDRPVKFKLEPADRGGTDLTLINEGLSDDDYAMVNAGWVSVLMNLKAAVDFNFDLRNHDPERTWDQGYADN